jgi:hypothetical protein
LTSNRTTPILGELKEVDLRQIWRSEAHEFTPWLLANASQLGEALGIEIELQRAEHPVGGFSLDLIGRDLTNSATLIVENQLEGSDHVHLGQLLTYAAGTDASTIVWITKSIRDEHRQALNWLNEHTDASTHFIGVEIALMQIDNSLPSPLFRIVVEPNDWQKAVRTSTSGQLGARALAYQTFWTQYLGRLGQIHPDWSRATPPASNELWMAAPIRGCGFKCAFDGNGNLRHELIIDRPTPDACLAVFGALHAKREIIERTYGRNLQWSQVPNRKVCRVIDSGEGDITESESHDSYIDFLIDAGERFRLSLEAVASLEQDDAEGGTESDDAAVARYRFDSEEDAEAFVGWLADNYPESTLNDSYDGIITILRYDEFDRYARGHIQSVARDDYSGERLHS